MPGRSSRGRPPSRCPWGGPVPSGCSVFRAPVRERRGGGSPAEDGVTVPPCCSSSWHPHPCRSPFPQGQGACLRSSLFFLPSCYSRFCGSSTTKMHAEVDDGDAAVRPALNSSSNSWVIDTLLLLLLLLLLLAWPSPRQAIRGSPSPWRGRGAARPEGPTAPAHGILSRGCPSPLATGRSTWRCCESPTRGG